MDTRICSTVLACTTTFIALGCGGSSEETSTAAATGGAASIGGASGQATGGVAPGTGGKATGGASSTATGGALVATGGSKATGGALGTAGSTSANGGSATGGAWVTGGSKATGGATATGDGGTNPEVDAMCNDVCTLLANRNPPLTCVPADCVGTCNKTFAQLAGANTVCSDAYVALFECGLARPASEWECFTVAAGTFEIDIPVPPRSAETCGPEFQSLYSTILLNLATCGTALSW